MQREPLGFRQQPTTPFFSLGRPDTNSGKGRDRRPLSRDSRCLRLTSSLPPLFLEDRSTGGSGRTA